VDSPFFQPAVFIALALVLPIVVLYAAGASRRKRLLPLASILDEGSGEVTGFIRSTLAGHFRGREVSFILMSGGKNSPPKFFIDVTCGGSLVFGISREDLGSRIAKTLHLKKDVEIGDADLDEKLVFSCREPERLIAWISGRDMKESVARLLLSRDVDRLAREEGRLRAAHYHYNRADLDPERVRGVLEGLDSLARSLDSAG